MKIDAIYITVDSELIKKKTYFDSSRFVSTFIFCVESDEPKDEQVEAGGNNGETKQDENEHECNVFGFIRKGFVLLQGDHVSEANCR